jgi:hypothetical protein
VENLRYAKNRCVVDIGRLDLFSMYNIPPKTTALTKAMGSR